MPIEAEHQITEKLIISDTNNLFRIDDHMFAPPSQAIVFSIAQVLVAANNQHACIIDCSSAESGLHGCRIGHVLELVEPVNNLRVTVLEPWAPFPGRFVAVSDEKATRPRVLELDEGTCACDRIRDHHVATKIPEEGILVGKEIDSFHLQIVVSDESRGMRM